MEQELSAGKLCGRCHDGSLMSAFSSVPFQPGPAVGVLEGSEGVQHGRMARVGAVSNPLVVLQTAVPPIRGHRRR